MVILTILQSTFRVRIVLVVVALAGAVVPISPTWIEGVYSRVIYPPLQRSVTSVSNLSPVALLDVALSLLLIASGVLWFRDWRLRSWRQALTRALGRLVTTAAVIYLLFLLTWGLNYRRVPLEAKLDFDRARISRDAAVNLASLAIQRLNEGAAAAHEAPFDAGALADSSARVQGLLDGGRAAAGRPKRSLAGLYFRQAAIDGMTVPVVLEVILNPDLLPIEIPAVLAHEWAHLAGYADESEANFIGWLAGVRSADPASRYSGWLQAYGLASAALPRNVRESLPPLNERPRQDLREIAARFARSSPVVRAAARGVYDSYLRANRIQEGIANYQVALQLMLGTRFDDEWKPRMKE